MSIYDPEVGKTLGAAIKSAESVQSSYLKQCFPLHRRVEAMIMSGQKVPSTGVISGVHPNQYGGEVRVFLDGSKARGSRAYRLVPAKDVKVIA